MTTKSVFRLSPLVAALWLAACGHVSLPATISVPTFTATYTRGVPAILLLPPSSTPRPIPTQTPTPRPTVTPVASASPTLGPLITRTLAPPAECPPPGHPAAIQATTDTEILTQEIQRFLDEGGSVAALRQALQKAIPPPSDGYPYVLFHVEGVDVTGDTTPDVVVSVTTTRPPNNDEIGGPVIIFSCQAGDFIVLLEETYPGYGAPAEVVYLSAADLNGNGLPEVVYAASTEAGGSQERTTVFVWEWDGSQFRQLVVPPGRLGLYQGAEGGSLSMVGESNFPQLGLIGVETDVDGMFPDTDGNGTRELVLEWSYGLFHSPSGYSDEVDLLETWAWNGQAMTLLRWSYRPSLGRYNIVRKGDEAFERGDLDVAVGDYWYEARLFSMAELEDHWIYSDSGAPRPEKPSRHPLTGYAQFRLLLTYTRQGLLDDAETILNLMHDTSPSGSSDYSFVEMADLFYAEFLNTNDLSAACRAAVAFAGEHDSEILTPIRTDPYGSIYFQSYSPASVCPIR